MSAGLVPPTRHHKTRQKRAVCKAFSALVAYGVFSGNDAADVLDVSHASVIRWVREINNHAETERDVKEALARRAGA